MFGTALQNTPCLGRLSLYLQRAFTKIGRLCWVQVGLWIQACNIGARIVRTVFFFFLGGGGMVRY